MKKKKIRYVLFNSLKALLWLAVFVVIYIVFKKYVDVDFLKWLQPLFENELLILMIFLISEIIVGIIPPELFIIWALRNDQIAEFIGLVSILAVVSYLAGITGYFIGRYLNTTVFYRLIKRRFLRKMDQRLQIFGPYLIIIAALTPLPFSGVSMLVGSVRYPVNKYVVFALTRFLRFILYALVFWKIDPNL